jgi:hypothetical protein
MVLKYKSGVIGTIDLDRTSAYGYGMISQKNIPQKKEYNVNHKTSSFYVIGDVFIIFFF